ncbi:MAG: hypothetical protein M1830_000866, partial [Pleopsidium flavum]
LEAELERELLASQQVDEREQQKAATYERQKAMQKEKRDSMKLARERAKQKQQGRAREDREAKERRQKEVEEEQRRKEAEDRAFEEELFGPEVLVGCGDDGEDNDAVGQQREADVFMGYMPENQISGPTMYGVLEESSEDSEEE